MEFPFIVNAILKERITTIKGGPGERKRLDNGQNNYENELMSIINDMGLASAKAQGLKSPITVYSRLLQTSGQCIYILKDSDLSNGNGSVLGFIKTGRKRLFLMDHYSLLHEVEPLSILDFYVHESQQRKGHGKVLFEHVLQKEGLQPFEVAIDRPSLKFLSFLRKHYHLSNHIKQNNNFVVFDKFFTTCSHIDYGRGTYRKRQSAEHHNHTPSHISLSPNKTQLYNNSSPHQDSSLSPPSLPIKDTPLPLATVNPVSITSLTSTSDTTSSSTSLRAPTSPWDLSQLQTTPNTDIKAPHLNMRSSQQYGRSKGVWLDTSQWGCGGFHAASRYPSVQYSRYNCDRERKSSNLFISSSATNPPSSSTVPSSVLSLTNTRQSSKRRWKDYLH